MVKSKYKRDPEVLKELINGFAYCDIGSDDTIALYNKTNLKKLPSSIKKTIRLAGQINGDFILKEKKGRSKIYHHVKNYDITKKLHYYDTDSPNKESILNYAKGYFENRLVDVAEGQGGYRGDYPFKFDWIIILDSQDG